MDHGSNLEKGSPPPVRQTIRNLLIEMLIYGVLLFGYFFIVLEFLGDPLAPGIIAVISC